MTLKLALDRKFGVERGPDRVDAWEDRAPNSLSLLDAELAKGLVELERIVQAGLFRFAARAKNYIWAMDGEGKIHIAVEELAVMQAETAYSGYPRRRGYRHPSEDKKLGHPTLLNQKSARIAGELAFDEIDGSLRWVFNANSGRYCRSNPPLAEQVEAVADIFRNFGLDVYVDFD